MKTGWYWLTAPVEIRSGCKYGWYNYIPCGKPVMIWVRQDIQKFYYVEPEGHLKSFKLKDIPTGSTWKGPLVP